MERFQELRDRAKKKIMLADHIITQTYPLIKDPKLLLSAIENIFLALTNSMGSLLHYERLFKRIPPFQDTFDSKFNIFKERCVEKYNIKQDYISVIKELKDIIIEHKKSPMEFVRNDRFVICSDNYRMKTIDIDKIKKMMHITKDFVFDMEKIVSRNEEIFAR
ncbi:MAG: hypothetical protein KAU20_05115 [Nanoarchaeota archaeon]|nr:hypothetical protein [Nanoarchaeota archaeon]